MKAIRKMKHFFCLLMAFIGIATVPLVASSIDLMVPPILVQKISSETLEKERDLFEKFIDSFCGVCAQQPLVQKMVSEAFCCEEQSYLDADPAILFFHALHEDQVVGYISCDLLPGYQVRIRQLAVDPLMFDVSLVKELLFAIFASVPRVKTVTVCCPVACLELATLFEDLGFVRAGSEIQPAIQLFVPYELKIHPKCKICDVLYADIWDTQLEPEEDDTDSNWSDPMGSLAEESDQNHEARTISPIVEDEQGDVL